MNQDQRDAHFSQMVEEELAERTVTAIARKNIEFALAHQNDSLEQLKKYLQDCAKKLGRTPTRTEIIAANLLTSASARGKARSRASASGNTAWNTSRSRWKARSCIRQNCASSAKSARQSIEPDAKPSGSSAKQNRQPPRVKAPQSERP